MTQVQQINRMFLLACAPFVGAILWLLAMQMHIDVRIPAQTGSGASDIGNNAADVTSKLEQTQATASQTKNIIVKFYQIYAQSTAMATELLKLASAQSARPVDIYDQRITSKLGQPIRQLASGNIELKLFNLAGNDYNGYALKVNLKTDKAMKMAIGKDQPGAAETTLDAVRRYGAAAGVNAGGFADDPRTGKRYPLDTTILNGKYIGGGFFPSKDDEAFIGISTNRKLIGGTFSSQQDLDKMSPAFGSTFVPVLLKGGVKQPIPYQWQTSPAHAPRTVVGSYKHDQLLFIVTDGADENGNSGATLAELQDRLLELGVRDAYNLDGGGSSTLIFDGQVINHPSDGKLRPLATNFLFFR